MHPDFVTGLHLPPTNLMNSNSTTTNHQTRVDLSLVIPCFNEGGVIPILKGRLLSSLPDLNLAWEVILIDDGSRDDTFQQLSALHVEDPRFKVISFSRNFGHQAAVFAGLFHATGDYVAVMDADLQDPPECLPIFFAKLQEGYDVVYAVRRKRKENLFKRTCYATFYRLLRLVAKFEIPIDSGDFCLMRQCVVSVMRSMPEQDMFVRGLRAWTGFRQIGIEYDRSARAAGETKYPFHKLVRLAMDGLFAFSDVPLRMAAYLGFLTLGLSFALMAILILWKIFDFNLFGHYPSEVPGWTSMICLILFISGIQFLILGVMGEFIGRIYNDVKQRPRWIVRESRGLRNN